MNIKSLSDKVLLPSKRDVLRLHLYLKLLQNKIRPLEKDIEIIIELYLFGGYANAAEQSDFIQVCLDKKYRRSDQAVRNTLSKYVTAGVFMKPRNTHLSLSEEFMPLVSCDRIILQHIVSHAE